MDPVQEIKARLPIEELVGQYCQVQKKGRNLVCVCPFHNDTHPSMVISPDKGIAFCFACQSGGDVFSFYQQIEGVDFRQALKDLAEKVGIEIADQPIQSTPKDEKDRLRSCLEDTVTLYRETLQRHEAALAYLQKRNISEEQIAQFEIGVAPDSFSATYEALLKLGYSRSELLKAGVAAQKDLQEGRMYDRFRNRLMFPIRDSQGHLVGFGGRTLGEDDAKYINSSDGPLYNKSRVLFGLHLAKEAMRDTGRVYLVEGYFDVLAFHRAGIPNVVACSGTALTEEHVKLLKRQCETVVLCLDQDQAGQAAAERAYLLCSAEELSVRSMKLDHKDPDEAVQADADAFAALAQAGGKDYLEAVIEDAAQADVQSVEGKRDVLHKLLPLLNAVPTAVERSHYIAKLAGLLGTTETTLSDDLARLKEQDKAPPVRSPHTEREQPKQATAKPETFNRMEIALGLLLLYPKASEFLEELIEPDQGFAAALYTAIKQQGSTTWKTDDLAMPEEYAERFTLLQLYFDHHEMADLSETMGISEVRKNFRYANRDVIQKKQQDLMRQILDARRDGKTDEERQLANQYTEVLKLAKIAR